ncbi:MAG: hypothetical protein ABTQ28_18350 [Thauera sp.]
MTTLKLRGFRRSYSMCQHHTTSVFAGAAAAANRPPQRSYTNRVGDDCARTLIIASR